MIAYTYINSSINHTCIVIPLDIQNKYFDKVLL